MSSYTKFHEKSEFELKFEIEHALEHQKWQKHLLCNSTYKKGKCYVKFGGGLLIWSLCFHFQRYFAQKLIDYTANSGLSDGIQYVFQALKLSEIFDFSLRVHSLWPVV